MLPHLPYGGCSQPRKRCWREEIVIQASGDRSAGTSRIILTPKLRAPSPRPEQLVRRGLLELLHSALDCKISVISAPTGYGKTTLLAHWLQVEKAEVRFAWVSLDEQDDDPIRLWRHIVEALRRVVPEEEGLGADVLVGMSAVGQQFVEITLPLLINELAELPRRVVVVLDDYQYMGAGQAHESVAYFLEHLPENVHLVVSSRSDPPLPLGRLRAMGEMNEIRTEQLAFTEKEAECLLNERMGLGIGPDDLSLLVERTEGWPAGIYLASLSLRDKEEKHAFIESFGGSDRYVVGLLGEEVLAGIDEHVRRFLLETSVLRRLTGPLCDAVTGGEGSARILRELASSNLFVVALDEQGEWYRYHHLLSELLLYELRSTEPELVGTLRGRARAWLEGEGYVESAIRQASEAEDHERVRLLIARHWYGYAVAGHYATVQGWLGPLPEGTIARDAPLCLVRAWLYALAGRREECEEFLILADGIHYEGPLPDGSTSVESGVATLRAVFGFGGIGEMVEAARKAGALGLDGTSAQAPLVKLGQGISWYFSGDLAGARRVLEGGLQLANNDHPLVRMGMLSCLSFVAGDEGQAEEAESLAREAQALVDRFGLKGVPQATWVPIALGRALAGSGDLEGAQEELERAHAARQRSPGLSPWPTMVGLLALAPVRAALGDRAGGRAMLAEVRAILEDYPDAGMFPELLERQERKLRARRPREGRLDEELTDRELDVVRQLGGDLSVRQIAQGLHVAPSTVRTQIKSIYRKFGVSSRDAAVQEAHARGMI
jgi:LuxR family transcriptional regulator, maltose regulon positive regulatory protein